jgi:mersacidin/lichenicidin family type 2 lantibiotic
MKFDIARAWKDENYRQSLSNEQINALPANPVGELELSNAELESVNGGNGFGLGTSTSSSSSTRDDFFHFHSLALRCNETLFSLTSVQGFSILSPVNAFCINRNRDDGGVE